jgi:hypothetical protein
MEMLTKEKEMNAVGILTGDKKIVKISKVANFTFILCKDNAKIGQYETKVF